MVKVRIFVHFIYFLSNLVLAVLLRKGAIDKIYGYLFIYGVIWVALPLVTWSLVSGPFAANRKKPLGGKIMADTIGPLLSILSIVLSFLIVS